MNTSGFLAVEQDAKTLVVTPRRDLGGFAREEVQDEMFEVLGMIDERDIRGVVLDLGAIDYFGSLLLEFVVRIRSRLHEKQGKLAICKMSPISSEVFHVAHFDSHFQAAGNRAVAMEMVSE